VAERAVDGDIGIVGRMAAGDPSALVELYDRYGRQLFGYLVLLTADRDLAEEVLQDTLLAAWRGAAGYSSRSEIRGWLYGIARRRARDAQRRRSLHLVGEAPLATLPSPEPDPEDQMLARATREEVAAALARLTPVQHEVLTLAFLHGLSQADMSEALAVPIGTVKSRLDNAKRALRAVLGGENGGEA